MLYFLCTCIRYRFVITGCRQKCQRLLRRCAGGWGNHTIMPFDVLPASLMVVLACWLGLSLLIRAPRDHAARSFAWLCLHLAIYSLGTAVGRVTASEAVVRPLMHRLELAETALLPAAFLHFMIIVCAIPQQRRLQQIALGLAYLVGVGLAAVAVLGPVELATVPHFPAGLVWLSVAQRVLPLLLALVLAIWRIGMASDDQTERGRRRFFATSVAIAVTGAVLASIAREAGWTQAPGHLLMDAGLALMAYMVLTHRMLLPARVAQRVFYRSLAGSLFTALYIVTVLALEPLARRALAIEQPLVTGIALAVLVAVFGPVRDLIGTWLDRRFFHREFDYGHLLRTVSEDALERGDLHGQLDAALSAICRTLGVRAGAVATFGPGGAQVQAAYGVDRPDGAAFAAATPIDHPRTLYGDWQPWPEARLLLPLRIGEQPLGLLALGPKRSGEAYREVERAVLDLLGAYLARTIQHATTQQQREHELATLAEQSRQLQAAQEVLEAQVSEAARIVEQVPAAPEPPQPSPNLRGLHVYALGPLRVEQDGKLIERWGGDKAGTYQAEALFAFLFDRRGRGVSKDEAEEVIWPDLDFKAIDKADTAFHRTLSGLRRTLEPALKRGNQSKLISYHHERYWLDPAAVGWCDVDAFVEVVERGHTLLRGGDLEAARACFRNAAALYRDDYLFDCPFFGDSSYVLDRRDELRALCVGALLALGDVYEQLGQAGEAASSFRRALAVSQNDCPRAEDALARLQVGV